MAARELTTYILRATRMSNEDNGNLCTSSSGSGAGVVGTSLHKPTSSSTEDLSEYTDADESISAPTEFLAEFLSAVMLKDYETALKYCKLILQYEPNNVTAKEFYPLILEKLRNISYNKTTGDKEDEESSSSQGDEEDESSGDGESSSSSGSSEDSEEGDEGSSDPADKRSSSDGDATTASYSSLEDEEADQLTNLAAKFRVDNVDLGNGNKIICDSTGSKLWAVKGDNNTTTVTVPFGTSSDSESPTEPISQQTIAMLRAKVVSPRH
ncbi:uncharacterized protein CBL_12592 [Carabus blaptoides fortunei]